MKWVDWLLNYGLKASLIIIPIISLYRILVTGFIENEYINLFIALLTVFFVFIFFLWDLKYARKQKSKHLKIFENLMFLWVSLVIISIWFGYTTIASGVIGSGVPGLYFFYQIIMKKPSIKLKEGVEASKTLIKGNSKKEFPVIHIYTSLKNTGPGTLKNGFVKISNEDDNLNYYGRWQGDEIYTDFHPKDTKKLSLMFLFPDIKRSYELATIEEEIGHNDKETDQQLFRSESTSPNQFLPVGEGKINITEIGPIKDGPILSIFSPEVLSDEEGWKIDEDKISNEYYNTNIKARNEYEVKLIVGGKNYNEEIELESFSIKDMLKKRDWPPSVETKLVKHLETNNL